MAGKQDGDVARRLRAVIDTVLDGIITVDTRGIIESYNPAASKIFGYKASEVIGKNISVLMPSPDREQHDTYMQNYLRTGHKKIIGIGREVEAQKKDGTIFPIRLAVGEVVLEDKTTIFTGIIHDLTQVKRAEQELIRFNAELESIVQQRTHKLEETVNKLLDVNKRLEFEVEQRSIVEDSLRKNEEQLKEMLGRERELSELKSRFVSMASHEFRTPLSTILSSVSLLKKYTLEEHLAKREKHIERIKSSVSDLNGILNDFLSLSKLEEGRVVVQAQPVPLDDLCEEVSEEMQGLLKEGQEIRHQADSVGAEVLSDRRILKNVLFNLLSNAIKYSNENDLIYCTQETKEDSLVLSITDQGIGIPEADQKHLFSRFFRASNAVNIKGTGLGLHIVKQYLELIGGSIRYESKENVGSTFVLTLPKNQRNAQDISH